MSEDYEKLKLQQKAAYNEWQDFAWCQHTHTELKKWYVGTHGSVAIYAQCLVCGSKAGSAVSKSTVKIECLSEANPELREAWKKKNDHFREIYESLVKQEKELLEQKRQQIKEDSLQVAEKKRREWREFYNDYLKSDKWKTKRRLTLRRDQGICQGCGDEVATDIHHITYQNLGNEFLWELISVCRPCHEQVHGRKFEDQDEDFREFDGRRKRRF